MKVVVKINGHDYHLLYFQASHVFAFQTVCDVEFIWLPYYNWWRNKLLKEWEIGGLIKCLGTGAVCVR